MKGEKLDKDAGVLKRPEFKAPGWGEKFKEALFGSVRPFQCMQIEVTSVCGNSCEYCPRHSHRGSWKSRHMKAETFAALWPLLRLAQRAHLQGWGEPFANPFFFDFAAFARKAGASVSTTSSGAIMNESLAEKIALSGMDIVAFSLAGADGASNSIRKGISFERLRESVGILKRKIRELGRGPEIHIAYILLADRMDSALKLPDVLEEFDANLAVVSTLDYISEPADSKWAILPWELDKIEKAREILEKASADAEARDRFIYFALPEKNAGHELGCRENAAKTLYVDADGDLSPCVYLNVPSSAPNSRRKVFGNAATMDPLKLWKSDDWRSFRSRLKGLDPDPVCIECPKRCEK